MAHPPFIAPTPLDVTLASQQVRQRVYKQPVIRRFKAPISSNTLPPILTEAIMETTAGPGLPLPPRLYKIPAKGDARRRYATSTPASRCAPVPPGQSRPRLSRPPSKLEERAGRVAGNTHSEKPNLLVKAESSSPSPPPLIPNDDTKGISCDEKGDLAMVYSVKTSPSLVPSDQSTRVSSGTDQASRSNDKMSLRNLLS